MSDQNNKRDVPAAKPIKKRPIRVRRRPFNLKTWAREMRSELKKVVWPTPKQIVNNTFIVVAAVILVGLIVAVFDLGAVNLANLVLSMKI